MPRPLSLRERTARWKRERQLADLNKYTDKAREAILAAQSLAQEANHNQVEPEHLLAALLSQADGVVPQVIAAVPTSASAGVAPAQLAAEVQRRLSARPKVYGPSAQLGLSRALDRVLTQAEREASQMRDEYVSTEHLLLALTSGQAGEAARLLGMSRSAAGRLERAAIAMLRDFLDPDEKQFRYAGPFLDISSPARQSTSECKVLRFGGDDMSQYLTFPSHIRNP